MTHIAGIVVAAVVARGAAGPVWPAPPDPPRIQLVDVLPDPTPPPLPTAPLYLKAFRWLVGLPLEGEAVRPLLLVRPTGLFLRGGALYVADPGRRLVVQIDLLSRRVVRTIPRAVGELASPVGVAVARDGVVFVSDSAAGRVAVYGANGRRRGGDLLPPAAPGFRPAGLAFDDRRDRLYVADAGTHRIHAFAADGRFLFTFGRRGGGPEGLNYPTYLWMDEAHDELLVCDSANFRVQRFAPDGSPRGRFGESGDRPGYLARPRGLGADSDRNVYVVDGALEAVQVFDLQGRLELWFGESGSDEGSFQLPGGLCVDGTDRVYVADTYNGRIQVFQYLKGSKAEGKGT